MEFRIDELTEALDRVEYVPDAIVARDSPSAIAFAEWWAWRQTQPDKTDEPEAL